VRPFDIRPGNALAYYPEANVLVPRDVDPESRTPAFMSVLVMYCIRVDDPTTLTARTCGAGATWDPQLFLFRAEGVGVAMDDDTCASGLQSEILGFANCANANTPGQYFIAISKFNQDPVGTRNELLFLVPTGCTSVSYCGGATAVEPTTWGSVKNFYK